LTNIVDTHLAAGVSTSRCSHTAVGFGFPLQFLIHIDCKHYLVQLWLKLKCNCLHWGCSQWGGQTNRVASISVVFLRLAPTGCSDHVSPPSGLDTTMSPGNSVFTWICSLPFFLQHATTHIMMMDEFPLS